MRGCGLLRAGKGHTHGDDVVYLQFG
jgi:hypothetical protein